MRLFSMGGVPPCDRRLDRRKVAIAAIAALFLFAASKAQAAPVAFDIDMSKSWMFQQTEFDLTAAKIGKFKTSPQVGAAATWGGPMGAGSDTSPIWGCVVADLTATTIKLLPDSALNLITTGVYAPNDPVVTDPLGPPPTGAQAGNFGLKVGSPLFFFANIHDARATFIPTTPAIALAPGPTGTFTFFPPAATSGIMFTEGRLALVSGFGNGTDSLAGDPAAFFSSGLGAPAPLGPDVGTWDGVTLTIPYTSYYAVPTVIDIGGTPTTITVGYYASGVIVATPKVPEPSTMVLLGFGVVGLMTCGWRLKKRKSLVS